MKKAVDSPTLYNCTATLLQQQDPGLDVKSVWTLNRSELIELLEATFSQTENTVKRTAMRDFLSECLFTLQNPYEMVWWQKLVWTVIFASMLVVATGGNTIVMWIVLGKYNIYKLVSASNIEKFLVWCHNCLTSRQNVRQSSWKKETLPWSFLPFIRFYDFYFLYSILILIFFNLIILYFFKTNLFLFFIILCYNKLIDFIALVIITRLIHLYRVFQEEE